jgi:RimJ/RimL family protein N-acetyltransferase
LHHGAHKFGLQRVIGVVSAGNTASIRVLEKLGMGFERMYPMHADEPEVRLYGRSLSA